MKTMIDTKEWRKDSEFTNDFLFLGKPLSTKDEGMFYERHARHRNGVWESTDGRRLHEVKDEQMPTLEEGYYKLTLKTKTRVIFQKVAELDEHSYPDTSVVWPNAEQCESVSAKGLSALYTLIVRAMKKNTVEIDYVHDVVGDDLWEACVYGEDRPIVFQNGTKRALVMPRRII